jgi:hypothetical protein
MGPKGERTTQKKKKMKTSDDQWRSKDEEKNIKKELRNSLTLLLLCDYVFIDRHICWMR